MFHVLSFSTSLHPSLSLLPSRTPFSLSICLSLSLSLFFGCSRPHVYSRSFRRDVARVHILPRSLAPSLFEDLSTVVPARTECPFVQLKEEHMPGSLGYSRRHLQKSVHYISVLGGYALNHRFWTMRCSLSTLCIRDCRTPVTACRKKSSQGLGVFKIR